MKYELRRNLGRKKMFYKKIYSKYKLKKSYIKVQKLNTLKHLKVFLQNHYTSAGCFCSQFFLN